MIENAIDTAARHARAPISVRYNGQTFQIKSCAVGAPIIPTTYVMVSAGAARRCYLLLRTRWERKVHRG